MPLSANYPLEYFDYVVPERHQAALEEIRELCLTFYAKMDILPRTANTAHACYLIQHAWLSAVRVCANWEALTEEDYAAL